MMSNSNVFNPNISADVVTKYGTTAAKSMIVTSFFRLFTKY